MSGTFGGAQYGDERVRRSFQKGEAAGDDEQREQEETVCV